MEFDVEGLEQLSEATDGGRDFEGFGKVRFGPGEPSPSQFVRGQPERDHLEGVEGTVPAGGIFGPLKPRDVCAVVPQLIGLGVERIEQREASPIDVEREELTGRRQVQCGRLGHLQRRPSGSTPAAEFEGGLREGGPKQTRQAVDPLCLGQQDGIGEVGARLGEQGRHSLRRGGIDGRGLD